MDILDLTNSDQIRGVLGVSPADLPDEMLEPIELDDDLSAALDDWLENWQEVRDGDDSKAARYLRLYAKYQCAATVAVSGQNFTLMQHTDGANAGQRSDKEGFQLLREHLAHRAAMYQDKLTQHLEPQTVATRRPLFGIVTPARDPVTEGR